MNTRTFNMIAGIAVVGIIAAVCVVEIATVSAARRKIERDNKMTRENLVALGGARVLLGEIEQLQKANSEQLQAMDREIDDASAAGIVPQFLSLIDAIARRHKVTLGSVSPQPGQVDGGYTRTPVQMSMTGPLKNIHEMLADIEAQRNPILIGKLRLTPDKKTGLVRATLGISLLGR